jgi:hypothetical protein
VDLSGLFDGTWRFRGAFPTTERAFLMKNYVKLALEVLASIARDDEAEDETRIRASATILNYMKTPDPR